jgi:signal transduction histidine kinase
VKRAARWWLVFGACNLVVVAALVRTSAVVVRLERSELAARAETDYQESLRLAMWRMDSWLSLFLAREAGRPSTLEPDSEFLVMRFAVDADGAVTTPAPARTEGAFERLLPYLRPEALEAAVARADSLVNAKSGSPERQAGDAAWQESQQVKSKNEFDARVACAVPRPPGADSAGRQVVAWLDASNPAEPVLAFVRRLDTGGTERFSGFVLDWPRLRERLQFEIRDLFPAASLERAQTGAPSADFLGLGLANVPAVLHTPPPSAVAVPGFTAGRAALGLAWLAVIGAMVAVGATLRKSIDLGERRRRFVSAVTHELRTPLTTFQMYTEMLADGVVTSEQQRNVYLRTLKEESRRLSAMVGNVLAHARLEDRRGPRHVESLTLASLIERVRPPLERTASSSGMTLEIGEAEPSAEPLSVDPEAIGQILANLVDNAAKYACGGESATIALLASVSDGSLVVTVRDDGPGVPREQARAIFAPFERGGRDSADPIPGVGLGLALSRGLARDMGGDLTLDAASGRGASFRLVLPARPD